MTEAAYLRECTIVLIKSPFGRMFGNPTLYYDIQAVSCFFRVYEQYSLCVEIQPKQVTFLNHSQPNDFFDILLLSCIVEFLGLAFRA